MVGDGEMRAEIDSQIETAGLHGRVTILGWLDGKKVREAIAGARALVLPSFAEGLPVVIMEAIGNYGGAAGHQYIRSWHT